jgi:hypothetical protein
VGFLLRPLGKYYYALFNAPTVLLLMNFRIDLRVIRQVLDTLCKPINFSDEFVILIGTIWLIASKWKMFARNL